MLLRNAMNKRTTIYILFKEYPDPNGRGKSVPYIQDSAEYLVHRESLMQDWTELFDVLDYFNYEPTNKYYDEENLEGLLDVAHTFPDEYPQVADAILSEMQSVGLTSWRTNAAERTETYFFEQYNVTTHLLGDMAQREVDRQATLQRIEQDDQSLLHPQDKEYESCVLLQNGAVVTQQGKLHIVRTGNRHLTLQSVDNIKNMHNWISQNRFPCRKYVYNAKHGDAYHTAQTFVDRHGNLNCAAQLLTDTQSTKEFLQKAVGDAEEGTLWYYDESNECCIYFENQGDNPQHEYHAYHLHQGEKNYDKINFEKLKKVLD